MVKDLLQCNAGDLGSIPGSGRSPGAGNGNPLQYYCLENPMVRGFGIVNKAEIDVFLDLSCFFNDSADQMDSSE